MTVAAAPTWVRALGSVVRRLPRGRYRVISSLRPSAAPFVAALARDAGGARFACDLTDQIAREVCLTGCYEPPVTRLLQRRLRPGGVMVDVGANWGYFSLLAAPAVGASGHVIALEPDPRQFARLESNLRLNAFQQVTAIPAGAGAQHGSAILTGYSDRSANRGVSRIEATAATLAAMPADDTEPRFQIECVPVDSLVTHFARVDVVKIDVEGAELDVLHGMRHGLAVGRYRALVLELHPSLLRERGISPDACLRPLLDSGYRGWMIDQSRRTYGRAIDPQVPSSELLLPLEHWQNDPWPHLFWLAPDEQLI